MYILLNSESDTQQPTTRMFISITIFSEMNWSFQNLTEGD